MLHVLLRCLGMVDSERGVTEYWSSRLFCAPTIQDYVCLVFAHCDRNVENISFTCYGIT